VEEPCRLREFALALLKSELRVHYDAKFNSEKLSVKLESGATGQRTALKTRAELVNSGADHAEAETIFHREPRDHRKGHRGRCAE
jgi:hypothetical protein